MAQFSCLKARSWMARCGGQSLMPLPKDTMFCFICDADERTWVHVIGTGDSNDPGLTREVLNTVLASLGRPALDS
jgi:hypothetical protein